MKHIVLFFTLSFTLISVVRGEEDLTCKAGYGIIGTDIRTSGPACSGLSKITTEAECKLAAEYNSKNNIDKNGGFGGRLSGSRDPPGCFYLSAKYWWNDNTKSTRQCSKYRKCICKTKTCIKCPINTYSKGGINPTCTPCPKDRPTTNFKTGQSNCIHVPTIKCEPGHGFINDGITKKKECTKCKTNTYSTGGKDIKCTPCPKDRPTTNFKTGQSNCIHVPTITCEAGHGFINDGITTKKECTKCKTNTYSAGGKDIKCTPCPKDRPTTNFETGQSKCIPVPTIKCEPGHEFINDGITKPKKCERCKYRSYSAGGDDVKCTRCAKEKPNTFLDRPQTSIESCTKDEYAATCKPGEGYSAPMYTSGSATQCSGGVITTEEECELAAEYNRKNDIDKNVGFRGRLSASFAPPGCYYNRYYNKYCWNDNTNSTLKCSNGEKCICKTKTRCNKCPEDTYNDEEGINKVCKQCIKPFLTNDDHTKCLDAEALEAERNNANDIKNIFKILEEQKEKTNDLSIKNSRLWQKEQIRLHHDKYMKERKPDDDASEKKSCEKQRLKGTVIFPAIEISNEIEKIEDTTCIDTNRDELLKSFCSFTSDLDNLFQIQSIDKEAKTFWPNICCKERRDTTLEVCKDPSGTLNRGEIVPFALSSGGNYSRHNLYVEVTDTIKKNGYLHKGMLDLLDSLLHFSKKNKAKQVVNTFFNGISLCGPRIIDEPGINDKRKLCELFIPYQHSMTLFYNLIEHFYMTPLVPQESSSSLFLETMEELLLKRQSSSKKNRLGKNNKKNRLTAGFNPALAKIMQSKPKNAATEKKTTCSVGTHFKSSELNGKKQFYCEGSDHLDLSNTNVKNIAIYYLKNEISTYYHKHMLSVKNMIRYDVEDTSCPSKLFDAKDISIQQVAMDTNGTRKEWVAVVNLNTKSEDGYLQSELPKCKLNNYLIGDTVNVKAYIDSKNCCDGIRDYKKCKKVAGCENDQHLFEMTDFNNKNFVRHVQLTGSKYRIEDTDHHNNHNGMNKRRRRRRLFASAGSASGSCANRL